MVTIAPSVRHFLSGQLDYLQSQGFDVSVLSSPGADLDEIASQDGVKAIPFPMAREISPVRDVRDLLRMLRVPEVLEAGYRELWDTKSLPSGRARCLADANPRQGVHAPRVAARDY